MSGDVCENREPDSDRLILCFSEFDIGMATQHARRWFTEARFLLNSAPPTHILCHTERYRHSFSLEEECWTP